MNPPNFSNNYLFPWLHNSLYDDNYVRHLLNVQTPNDFTHNLHTCLQRTIIAAQNTTNNEAQLEDEFVKPLLEQLGWHSVKQLGLTAQGKFQELDWALTLSDNAAHTLKASREPQHITAILECKAASIALDNGKANASNPHFQLMQYLNMFKVAYGFLTNGALWRFYDNNALHSKKAYLEFNLTELLAIVDADEQARAVALFALYFAKASYEPTVDGAKTNIQSTATRAADYAFELESNLKSVIYGTDGEDSLFERIGQAIYTASPNASLEQVYENAMVLLYRLLFIVYFEDNNRSLLEAHPHYQRRSLAKINADLKAATSATDFLYDGIYDLRHLFTLLNEGAVDINIPLLNGGLFDPTKAPLLSVPKLFSNAALRDLLAQLLYKTQAGKALLSVRRDYKNMSITHLGRIYEGLLEYRFIQVLGERPTYIAYKKGKTTTDAYLSAYELAVFEKAAAKDKSIVILKKDTLKEGHIYLRSASNSRKTTASYYTPTELSSFLIKAGIDRALDIDKKSIASLTILDNACGSGHFLVEALGYLSQRALASINTEPALQALLNEERAKITEQLHALQLTTVLDDAQILKRALLKRCIYGVDLNPFAVELTRLSLWIDSFIFGTPLSFIEHHIQHGNALMGATQAEFLRYTVRDAANDLFSEGDLNAEFLALSSVMGELSALRDTTSAEVQQSKIIYTKKIAPKLSKLSRALSLISTRRMWTAQGRSDAVKALDALPELAAALFNSDLTSLAELPNARRTELALAMQNIQDCAAQHHFFHYEIAFPEVFANPDKSQQGFDLICGNPPWDKTKFSDADFFPQYHSNYRSLKNSEKAAVQKEQLAKPAVKAAYDAAKTAIEHANDYYKVGFPLNAGAGDGNLFRLFVERNLNLLKSGGSLNYVLPSALLFEEGSQTLRQHIFKAMQMPFFYSFENREPLFPEVDSRYKFAMMQIVNTPLTAEMTEHYTIDTAFYLGRVAELKQDGIKAPYPLRTLKTLSPQQWALMELKSAADLPILQRCYAAFAPLHESWLNFRNELHMTADKDLFLETPAQGRLPLFEGKMIWQYNAALSTPQYWLNQADFDARLASKEIYRMAQDFGISRAEAEKHAHAVRYDREFYRIAFRGIASDTNERTLIFSLLPKGCGVGNSLSVSVPKTYVLNSNETHSTAGIKAMSCLRLLFALAWFNSLPCDWLARFTIQINVNQTYLYRLPMPQPTDDEILANPTYQTLAKNAALLTLHSDWAAFEPLAALFDVKRDDLPKTDEQYDRLRYQNDKLVAECYGLNAADLRHILKGFPVMLNKRSEYGTLFG
jgi:N-6 DNA Methylase